MKLKSCDLRAVLAFGFFLMIGQILGGCASTSIYTQIAAKDKSNAECAILSTKSYDMRIINVDGEYIENSCFISPCNWDTIRLEPGLKRIGFRFKPLAGSIPHTYYLAFRAVPGHEYVLKPQVQSVKNPKFNADGEIIWSPAVIDRYTNMVVSGDIERKSSY